MFRILFAVLVAVLFVGCEDAAPTKGKAKKDGKSSATATEKKPEGLALREWTQEELGLVLDTEDVSQKFARVANGRTVFLTVPHGFKIEGNSLHCQTFGESGEFDVVVKLAPVDIEYIKANNKKKPNNKNNLSVEGLCRNTFDAKGRCIASTVTGRLRAIEESMQDQILKLGADYDRDQKNRKPTAGELPEVPAKKKR